MREMPKFYLIWFITRIRELLRPVGKALVEQGPIETHDDIYFLRLAELRLAVRGEDMRTRIASRHAIYEQEMRRRHIPRILLSDGVEPTAVLTGDEQGHQLRGVAASAGSVRGKARVILNPLGAHLEPGEILVAPSTDPGWTPLFLTAGGLVMEMGGSMSHGAVVAREYSIPAVVGVAGAIERIKNGQQLQIDGIAGIVTILDEEETT
jgi:pyruvate,water dikinase